MTNKIEGIEPEISRLVGGSKSDLYGFVVVDKSIAGHATGGVRCSETVTLDEVARLAREMTYKFAFLHIPSGGAKAGVVVPAGLSDEERSRIFSDFGEAIGDLIRDGKYVTGVDMGTSPRDLEAMLSGAGLPVRPHARESDIDPNYFTALTVFVTAQALLEARGSRMKDCPILLEGLGKVGTHLLRLLAQAGATIVGVSTQSGAIVNKDGFDADSVLEAAAESGDDFVRDYPDCDHLPSTDLFLQSADLLIPGAGADSLNEHNVNKIRARWIVPIANISATPEIEAELHQRGIDFVPGFVSNSGGVFCWFLGRLSADARETIIRDRFKARISRLIKTADGSGQSIATTARGMAQRNYDTMRRIDDGDPVAHLMSLGHKLSPRRLGYVVSSKLFGKRCGQSLNFLMRSYFDSRYFR